MSLRDKARNWVRSIRESWQWFRLGGYFCEICGKRRLLANWVKFQYYPIGEKGHHIYCCLECIGKVVGVVEPDQRWLELVRYAYERWEQRGGINFF